MCTSFLSNRQMYGPNFRSTSFGSILQSRFTHLASNEMMKQRVCIAAVILWIMTSIAAGWLFAKGWTTEGSDGRTEILNPFSAGRAGSDSGGDAAALEAVDSVIGGLEEPKPDLKAMEAAAMDRGRLAHTQGHQL